MQPAEVEIDADQLYSRQKYVVGVETQAKYGATRILIVGGGGLAAEMTKNLVLTGVKSVQILDDAPITISDLGTNFFFKEKDVGKLRGETMAQAAKEMNRFVDVSSVSGTAITHIPHVDVVIFANQLTAQLIEANKVARTHGVKMISCESRGVCGCIFVDGGETLEVLDVDGEETVSCVVTGISRDGIVTVQEDKNHECGAGSKIYFTGLTDAAAANTSNAADPTTWKLLEVAEVISPHILRVKDFPFPEGSAAASHGSVLGSGCYLHTTKQRLQMHFLPLEESLAEPEFATIFDGEAKFSAATTLHAMFTAMGKVGSVPAGPAEVEAVVAAAKSAHPDAEEAVLRRLLPSIHGDLNPMACLIGGLASQEALKLCSGKFAPLHQWLYYDAREVLEARDGGNPSGDAAAAPVPPSRYAGQAVVVGADFQSFLSSQHAFIVGAGALGCELIKNAALMGFGGTSITDMDSIEMSNLSRQFLFRQRHIGRPKSAVAAEAARTINPAMQIVAYESKMGAETEGVFNEKFWDSHAVILNALDNVLSRKYVDARCVFYQKPLFESGTLGTKCNMQPVIPYVTESYGSSYDPPEKSIPLCTLKNFPNAIEHTIQWARDLFHLLFASTPADVNSYLKGPAAFKESLRNDPAAADTVVKQVYDALGKWPQTHADCIKMARLMFDEHFVNNFQQLLYNIPLDKRNEDGQLFWSGAKKPPTPQPFNPADEQDAAFVYHTAVLLARVYGLPAIGQSVAEVAQAAAAVQVPDFVPRHAVFATSEKQTTQQASPSLGNGPAVDDLPPASAFAGKVMHPEEFEKDDVTNHHVQFITYCSNVRARAYSIPVADFDQTKRIAGKIIPAMVTTTSLVTGLVGFEVLKYLLQEFRRFKAQPNRKSGQLLPSEDPEKLVTLYRSAFVNIALPFMAFSDPIVAPGRSYALPDGGKLRWGIWDRIDVNEGRDLSVKDLVAVLEERYQMEVFMLALTNGKMVYSQFGGKAKDKERLVSAVAQERGETIQDGMDYLDIVATGMIGEDDDVDVPTIRYKFRNF